MGGVGEGGRHRDRNTERFISAAAVLWLADLVSENLMEARRLKSVVKTQDEGGECAGMDLYLGSVAQALFFTLDLHFGSSPM